MSEAPKVTVLASICLMPAWEASGDLYHLWLIGNIDLQPLQLQLDVSAGGMGVSTLVINPVLYARMSCECGVVVYFTAHFTLHQSELEFFRFLDGFKVRDNNFGVDINRFILRGGTSSIASDDAAASSARWK
jgi:hypothetical protein